MGCAGHGSRRAAPTAKADCYVNDGATRDEVERRGFAEVRRFWRMKVDHWSVEGLSAAGAGRAHRTPGAGALPEGYRATAVPE